MTKQETFDIVVKNLRRQNAQSEEDGSCMYRGPNGLRCAAGWLIPDDKYKEDFEGCSVNSINVELDEVILGEGHDLFLARELQNVHDNNDVEYWEEEFEKVADIFDLDYAL